MPEKLDKSQIIGLPEGASIQFIKGKWYVYFAYSFKIGDNRYQERDYIGTIEGNKFIPNDYYIDHHPDKKHRPLRKWKNPEKAKKEQAKAQRALEREQQLARYIEDYVDFRVKLSREQLMRDVAKMEEE